MFFKRKRTKTKNTNDCKIHFKNKGTCSKRQRKSRNISFLKPKAYKPFKKASNSRANRVKKIKRKNTILALIFFITAISLVLFSAYSVINFIIGIRGGTSIEDISQKKEFVEGMDSVPIYPNSEFVYQDTKNKEVVMKMLNLGLSVYRLPRNTKTTDVYDFYSEELVKMDWEYITTVPVSTEKKLLGQYWLKNEKGLRIHVENNDIWYEILTKNQAESALSERREAQIQRKRVLETSSEQNLLPDYPWILTIPRDFLTRYSSTDIGELQSVEIFEIAGESKFLIYPIGKYGDETYDQMLHSFFEKQSERKEEDWEIINTIKDFQKDREVLKARIIIEGEEGEGIVFVNERNFIVYAIISNKKDHPFFEQIINEIHEP